jgi:hypothetical protein
MVDHHVIRGGWMSRQKSRLLIVVAFAILSFVGIERITGQSAGSLEQRFQNEAPAHWENYRSFAYRLQGRVAEVRKRDGKMIAKGVGETKQNSNCKLFVSQSVLKGATGGEATCYNLTYAFSLRRKGEGPWILTTVERRREGAESRIIRDTDENAGGTHLLLKAEGIYLGDLVRQPMFRLLKATSVPRPEGEALRVEFDNAHAMTDHPFCAIQGGEMVLDPNRCWYLHSATFRCKFGNGDATVKIESELRDPQAIFPIPRRVVRAVELRRSEGPMTVESVYDCDLQEPTALPEDHEFTLSAFGLAEPIAFTERATKKPTRWYRWAALSGFVFLGLAALIRWWVRKANAKTTQ